MPRTTKITAIVIMPVLTAAFVILYLFPGRTPELWAWTMTPDMTAVGPVASRYAWVIFLLVFVAIMAWIQVHMARTGGDSSTPAPAAAE